MSMDSFDGGGWMNNWGNSGVANPWQTSAPAPAPAAAAPSWSTQPNTLTPYAPPPMAQPQTPASVAPDVSASFGGMFGAQPAGGDMYSTRPEPYMGANAAPAAGPAPDYYGMGASGTFGATYKPPDWMRTAGLGFMQDRDATNAFFAANPQYAEDWKRITSGGNSQFSTDGTSLIKTNFNSMAPEAAAHYAKNPNELLAAEGFGYDPTLQYMNYYKGPGAIGADIKRNNPAEIMSKNRWTPNGIQAANVGAMQAATPFGSGYQSFLAAGGQGGAGAPAGGGSAVNTKPMQIGGGGSQGGGGYTGTPAGSGGGGSYTSSGGQNPYSQTLADMLATTMTNNWQRRIAPQLASQAVAAGGFGGSRQGVLEANSANDLNLGIGNALANLASNNFNTSTQYDLGMANNALGYANLDRAINNDNLGWRMQGAQLGMSMQDRLLALSQLGLNLGTNIQNTPMNYWSQFANQYNGIGQGFGASSASLTQPGSRLGAALGGAQIGSRWGQGIGGSAADTQNWTYGGSGTNRGPSDNIDWIYG